MEREYFQFYDGEKMGIKTIEDGVIIPPIYDMIEMNSDGLFCVTKGTSFAYFNLNGETVLPFENRFDSYGNFTEGLARVRINDKWGFINKKGDEVIEPKFHHVEEFSEGVATVRNENHEHGLIDKNGIIVLDYKYRLLLSYNNGFAKFGDINNWGLIDIKGNEILPPKYFHIGDVNENKVVVQIKEGDQYKEGVYTIGKEIEWNYNLDKVNKFNKRQQLLVDEFERLINEMNEDGCPCEYQRFRNFIQWNRPVSFMDQEKLFDVFSKYLKKEGDTYSCNCGTLYNSEWDQYSAFLWVLNVNIEKFGNCYEKGAPIASMIPFSLGFQGHEMKGLDEKYYESDNKTLIKYLKVKGTNNGSNVIAQEVDNDKEQATNNFWSKLKSMW